MSYGPAHWHCRIKRVRLRGNVYLFPGTTEPLMPARQQPHRPTISVLQDRLAEAASGELQALGLVWIDHDGEVWRVHTSSGFASGSKMMGALSLLADDISEEIRKANG